MQEKYEVRLLLSVEKDLYNLQKDHRRIVEDKVSILEENPYKGEVLKEELKDCRSLKFFLPGLGEYRVIYTVKEDEKICLLVFIGTRENLYAEAVKKIKALRKSGSL